MNIQHKLVYTCSYLSRSTGNRGNVLYVFIGHPPTATATATHAELFKGTGNLLYNLYWASYGWLLTLSCLSFVNCCILAVLIFATGSDSYRES